VDGGWIGWIDARLPLRAILRLGTAEEIPGGARFAYALGSATLFVFLLQVATGCVQLLYYVPTLDHAYDSLMYLRTEVAFGWLVHGLHYWGASAMVVLVGLHMVRVFVWGAYKRPRELVWLAGVALFLLTAGLVFSGAPLPWDERGYWAGEVGTSMAGTVPLAGDALKRLLRGGDAMGQLALSRMFVLHVAILPAALAGMVLVHLAAFRIAGSVGPWRESRRRSSGPFWPDQVFRDALLATLVFLLLVTLAAFAPPPISGPADPLDSSYVPSPEWNFVFLYEALRFLPGALEAAGTVGIPLLGILLLVAFPFFDRGPERDPARRPFAMAGLVLVLAGGIGLTVAGLRHQGAAASQSEKPAAVEPPAAGVEAEAAAARVSPPSPAARRGAELFHGLGCIGCHRVHGEGGTVGPDLSGEGRARSRAWLEAQIRDPARHFPGSPMPAFANLSDAQLGALVAYLSGLRVPRAASAAGQGASTPGAAASAQGAPPSSAPAAAQGAGAGQGAAPRAAAASAGKPAAPGAAARVVGSARHGAALFNRYCVSCHGPAGRGGVANPGSEAGAVPALRPVSRALFSPQPETFAANLDRFLQHGARPGGPHPVLTMPAFGDTHSLTQAEIADLEAYVMSVNGVDRAAMEHPGMSPRLFAATAWAVCAGAGLLLWLAWLALGRRSR
jgi:ubiquinol-cytochrome c reductase cytochrome b subunit